MHMLLLGLLPQNQEKQHIDLFHNGSLIKHSFVLILISLSSLAVMHKIQKNMLTKMRPVGPININTIEY